MNYGLRFVTLFTRQGSRPFPWKRNAKKAKWLSKEALQIVVKRREGNAPFEDFGLGLLGKAKFRDLGKQACSQVPWT